MTVKDILELIDESAVRVTVAVRTQKGPNRVLFDQDSTYREFKAVRDLEVIGLWPGVETSLLIYVKEEG